MSDETTTRTFGTFAQTGTEADAVADIATAAAQPHLLDLTEKYSVVVPAGATVEVVDLERFLPQPSRAKGVYRPATVGSLIEHVKRHRDPDGTTIWVHPTDGRIVAVFNDHATDSTGWRDHRSELQLRRTPEWDHWLGKDGRQMSQVDFAEHIEDGLPEIVNPDAATLLELAQNFHAHPTATFRAAHRLQDGSVQARYDEEVDAKAGTTGQIEIPSIFELAIAPFLGEDRSPVTARLRYRLGGGRLTLGYKLERPNDVVNRVLTGIAEKLTGEFEHVFLGEPPQA